MWWHWCQSRIFRRINLDNNHLYTLGSISRIFRRIFLKFHHFANFSVKTELTFLPESPGIHYQKRVFKDTFLSSFCADQLKKKQFLRWSIEEKRKHQIDQTLYKTPFMKCCFWDGSYNRTRVKIGLVIPPAPDLVIKAPASVWLGVILIWAKTPDFSASNLGVNQTIEPSPAV